MTNLSATKARFWSKVAKADDPAGCWLWTGALQTSGYGHVWIEGRTRTAHKVSFEWLVGPVPKGLQLDHLCRVRHCVNPKHLEAVTSWENSHRSPITVNTINAAKTHCPRGHLLSTPNKYGKRRCTEWCDGRPQGSRLRDKSAAPEPNADVCPEGHPYRYAAGRRWCPACRADKARARYESKRSPDSVGS